MDNHKPAAERIRPILQAMERSIDSARRSRVSEPVILRPASLPPAIVTPAPLLHTIPPQIIPGVSSTTGRLKARPKRLNGPLLSSFAQPAFRTQVG